MLVEVEAERRATCRREHRSRVRHVIVHVERLDRARRLLGHDEHVAVVTEGDLRRARRAGPHRPGRVRDRREPVVLGAEAADVAAGPAIEDVQQVVVHGEADRRRPAGGDGRLQLEPALADGEARDRVAPRVDGVEVVAVEDHGALRAQPAAGAVAARRIRDRAGEGAVGGAAVREYGVAARRVAEDVDGARGPPAWAAPPVARARVRRAGRGQGRLVRALRMCFPPCESVGRCASTCTALPTHLRSVRYSTLEDRDLATAVDAVGAGPSSAQMTPAAPL